MYSQHPAIAKRWRKESGPQRGLKKRVSKKKVKGSKKRSSDNRMKSTKSQQSNLKQGYRKV